VLTSEYKLQGGQPPVWGPEIMHMHKQKTQLTLVLGEHMSLGKPCKCIQH